MPLLVAAAVVIALVSAGLAVRARKSPASSPAREHTEWMRQVTRAATGLDDLPNVEAEHQ